MTYTATLAAAAIGSMLRDLHAELCGYPGQLPALAPLGDIPAFLATPAPAPNSMVAPTMQLERHERGIHAV